MGLIRIRSVWTGVAGSPYYTNQFFSASNSAEAQDAMDAVLTLWNVFTNYLRTPLRVDAEPFVPSINVATGAIVGGYDLDPGTGVQFTSSGDLLPPATQMLIRETTGVYAGGRQIRGRSYMPGWGEGANSVNGTVDTATRTLVQGAFNDLLGGSAVPVVYSPKNGQAEPITAYSVWEQWSVLRSRRD